MKYGYLADEIFEIAEDIEREGQMFYQRAAERACSARCKELFSELADAEANHILALRAVRKQVIDDRDDELRNNEDPAIKLYLRVVARGAVFGRPEDMEQALKACETEDGVLALAINKELDAILYLNEMKSLVQTEEALKALDIIIAEERSHVTDLATHRDELMSQT